ncbi:MAG: hypothetical protein CM15mP77_2890 [Synechococcus sp.]|nr:MAG: hypothetical protein CM15mP77_2890 [Synechococcus sp.]
MGAQRFARETGVSQSEAKEFLAKYKQRYPKVFAFLELQERLALSRGYVETILAAGAVPLRSQRPGAAAGQGPLEIDLDVARRGAWRRSNCGAAAKPDSGLECRHHQSGDGAACKTLCSVRAYRPSCCCRCTTNWCSRWRRMPWATRELVVQTMEQASWLSVPLVVETGVGRTGWRRSRSFYPIKRSPEGLPWMRFLAEIGSGVGPDDPDVMVAPMSSPSP